MEVRKTSIETLKSKTINIKFCVFFVLFLFILLFVTGVIYDSSVNQRVRQNKSSLILLRSFIQQFREEKNRFPKSLEEVRNYASSEKNNTSLRQLYIDFNREKQTSITEHNVLNGEGGYYYSKETGEVKVNLTKPIKYYIKLYLGSGRSKIPSEW